LHHIPNIISVLRILLVLPIAIQLYHEAWMNAFILFFIAGVSDGIDGFLARAFKWQSKLGSILDPIADKLLLTVIFVTLAYKGIIPVWFAMMVVARDIIILLGAMSYHWVTRELNITPLFSSKINTGLQISYVLALIYHMAISPLSETLLQVLQVGVAISILFSGISYVVTWTRLTIEFCSRNKTEENVANNQKQK
jgi:cardiolipin synthase